MDSFTLQPFFIRHPMEIKLSAKIPSERHEEEKTFAPFWDSKAGFPVIHPLTLSLY
jgi:hypothetical protein